VFAVAIQYLQIVRVVNACVVLWRRCTNECLSLSQNTNDSL